MSQISENEMQQRIAALVGDATMQRLHDVRVLLFGVGGVGSWCAECLVRSGVRHLTMVDFDIVCASNCNRQLMATPSSVGQRKVEVLRERLLQLNPEADIVALTDRYTPDDAERFHLGEYDFILDAIDDIPAKMDLILRATALPKSVTFFSSMGAALRMDPFAVRKAEFWNVKGDPLARALRNKFKREKRFPTRKFYCVYSEECCERTEKAMQSSDSTPIKGSLCHVTAIFGMALAGMVIDACRK